MQRVWLCFHACLWFEAAHVLLKALPSGLSWRIAKAQRLARYRSLPYKSVDPMAVFDATRGGVTFAAGKCPVICGVCRLILRQSWITSFHLGKVGITFGITWDWHMKVQP